MVEKEELNPQIQNEGARAPSKNRIELVLEAMIKLAGQNFDIHLPISKRHDEIDAIMLSLNMLGEELRSYTEQLEWSREQIAQSAKLASLGEMASGLSHELNNPLFILTGFTQVIMEELKENHGEAYQVVEGYFGELAKASERIRKIIDHMRDFSRQSTNHLENTSLNQVLQNAFVLLNEQLALRQIAVEFTLFEGSLEVFVDRIKLEQVFFNLITNARDAIEEKNAERGGTIYVTTALDHNMAQIRIKDDGCGMDPVTKSKIFDAFFTTKEVGKGTGLGLSVSYGILQSLNAEIHCDSTPMEGTEFTISIPLAETLETQKNS